MEQLICKECNKPIEFIHRAVLLKTFQGAENIEDVLFHFDCYLQWFNRSVEARAMKVYNDSMQIALGQLHTILNDETNTLD